MVRCPGGRVPEDVEDLVVEHSRLVSNPRYTTSEKQNGCCTTACRAAIKREIKRTLHVLRLAEDAGRQSASVLSPRTAHRAEDHQKGAGKAVWQTRLISS
ncbi:MAG: hypothetical protein ACLRZH_00095 [Ruthenibacterium lactatiformans]